MTAILICYDQAHYERLMEILDKNSCRGFTRWQDVQGRGSHTGEPHYGSHAWPSMSEAILTVVDSDERAQRVLEALRRADEFRPKLGLRAFAWPITATI